MRITAELKYLRISPRKVRLVANTLRGRSVPEAERVLRFLSRRAARPLEKLLSSAVANAKQNFQIISPRELVVADIHVNSGPTLKRSRPRAFGRSSPIRKRTSHITLVLESRGIAPKRRKAKKPGIAVVRREQEAGQELGTGRTPEREAFREKARVSPKTADFVSRMFRRKAI